MTVLYVENGLDLKRYTLKYLGMKCHDVFDLHSTDSIIYIYINIYFKKEKVTMVKFKSYHQ
jgi:hypothetical protein